MRAVQTLEGPRERVASARDLKSRVISAAKTILCHSSLQRADPFFAATVLAQIAPLSREPSIALFTEFGEGAVLADDKQAEIQACP